MCLRWVSEIIILANLKLHIFLKPAGCPRGGGHQIRAMTDKGEGGGEGNLTFCRTSFVDGPEYTNDINHCTWLRNVSKRVKVKFLNRYNIE